MRKQFTDIDEWQRETFPQSTAITKLAHLDLELKELKSDIESNSKDKRLELADCFMLLIGIAAFEGFTYEDVIDALEEKMKINKRRKWGEPDSNGVVSHIKNSANE